MRPLRGGVAEAVLGWGVEIHPVRGRIKAKKGGGDDQGYIFAAGEDAAVPVAFRRWLGAAKVFCPPNGPIRTASGLELEVPRARQGVHT